MSSSADRAITIVFQGDVAGTQELEAAENTTSPAGTLAVVLSSGNNTIAVPTGATAVTIAKASDNVVALVVKGVAGDTGIRLHDTDPDSLSLHASQTSFVINAASAATVRFYWS